MINTKQLKDFTKDELIQRIQKLSEKIREIKEDENCNDKSGEMISMIAHQWRQPLTVITTSLSTIKTRIELGVYDKSISKFEDLSNDIVQVFEKIENSALFMSTTINNFRNFYSFSNEVTIFNVQDSINSVISLIEDKVLITKNFCNKQNSSLKTFEGELKQVFLNILKNAIDALVDKNVESPIINICIFNEDNYCIVTIEDNAGGIPNNIIDKIFDPYFSTKSKKNGTGIGLYMSKTIIKNHINGSLTVQNTSLGAKFTIKIPRILE